LIASVAFLVNTTPSGSAPTNAQMSARPCLVCVGGFLHQLVGSACTAPLEVMRKSRTASSHLQRALRRRTGIQATPTAVRRASPVSDRKIRP
jgi:hypothetical protein